MFRLQGTLDHSPTNKKGKIILDFLEREKEREREIMILKTEGQRGGLVKIRTASGILATSLMRAAHQLRRKVNIPIQMMLPRKVNA